MTMFIIIINIRVPHKLIPAGIGTSRYFTFVAVLSFFSFSPVSPVTTISPLLFVMGIAITKEGVEDHKRHQSDREVNHSLVRIYNKLTN
jgi:hypothetical protein